MQRKKGDGSFKKLPNGTVEFTISVGYDIYGKRQRKKFYGKTETECRKMYKEFLKGGEKQPSSSKEYTLSDWLDIWLKTYKENKVQSSTYDDYVNLSKHVKEHKIGKMKLSNIKPIHITEFFTDFLNYSKSFTNQMRFVLNGGFECAIDNDLCLKNPVKRAEITKKTQPEKESFTEDEVKIIIDFAKTDNLFGIPIYLMLNTDMRSGEMRALTIDKIDLEKGIIFVDKSIKSNGELGLPKNGKARIVPLNLEAVGFLKEKLNKETRYLIGDSYYISADGFKSRYNWFFNRLNTLLKNTNRKPIFRKPPHSTRHTCATLWQDKGMPMELISELLGHQSTGVTKRYTHTQINTLTQAVEKYTFAI